MEALGNGSHKEFQSHQPVNGSGDAAAQRSQRSPTAESRTADLPTSPLYEQSEESFME